MIGRTLGHYRVVEQIGMGGMATVYKAFDPDTDRYVALKILPEHYSKDPNFQERFRREAKAIARLEHIHILPVHAYGEQEGTSYLVMRLMETGTLSDRIKRGPIPLDETSRLLSQIASALDYAHSQGIIHRDIKPSNILLDRNNNAFLTDFGIAKMVESPTIDLTGTGIVGTPQYMSPEQCRGDKNLTPASDIYSLGVVLYEMVTGSAPFQAETPLAVIHMQLNEPLPPPRTIRPNLNEQIESVILKALAKAPESRYPSCTAMANAFAQAVAMGIPPDVEAGRMTITPSSEPTRPSDTPDSRTEMLPKKRRVSPWVFLGIGALALVVVAAIAWSFLSICCAPPLSTTQTAAALAQAASNTPPISEAPALTPTFDARGPAQATIDAENAINAERTAIFLEGQTATATLWTAIPTATATLTYTPTPAVEDIIAQGDDYAAQGNYEAAAASYTQALALDPDNADFYLRLGSVYVVMDNPEEGLQAFTRAAELDPDSAQAFAQLGHTYFHQGDYEQAISNFDRALELDSGDASAYENRANAYYFLEQYEQAIADYDRALELIPASTSVLNNRGDAYSALGNFDAAIADYSRVIELEPDDPYAYLGLGRVYDNQGSYDEALTNYLRYLELVGEGGDPAITQRVQELETLVQIEALITEGDSYAAQGDFEAAVASFTQAIALDPDSAWAYNNRASVYNYGLQDYEAAIADYTRVIELDPDWNPDIYLERGEAYLSAGNYEAAIADLEHAIRLNAGTVQNAHYSLGDAHAAAGDLETAIEDFTRAIELDPAFTAAYIRRGDIYFELGDAEQAIASYTQAIETDPGSAWAYNNRGNVYNYGLQDYPSAIADYSRSLELDPNWNPDTYINRGDAYLGAGDYDSAIADYQRAIDLNLGSTQNAYYGMGDAYAAMGDFEQALAAFAQAIETDPTLVAAYIRRGDIYSELSDYDSAIAEFSAAIELDPNSAWAYNNRGYADMGAENYEQAIADFSQVIELDPTFNPEIYILRGDAYQAAGDYEAAIADYTQAIEISPDSPWAFINRGRAYSALGDLDSAIDDFSTTIELQPDFVADAYHERGAAYDAQGNPEAALADFHTYLDMAGDDADPAVVQRVSELEEQLAAPGNPIVTVGNLGGHIRAAPDGDAERLATVAPGQEFTVTGISRDGNYFQVDFNGQVGWISARFVNDIDTSSLPVIDVVLDTEVQRIRVGNLGGLIRAAPAGDAERLAAVDPGQELTVTGISLDGSYYRVDYNGQVGWISARFVTLSSDNETTSTDSETVLFSDDFEDGNAEGWELEPGAEVVQDVPNNYVLRVIAPEGDNYVHTWVGDTGWEDYALEFRVRVMDTADDGSHSIGVNLRIDWDRDGCAEYFVGMEEWGAYVQREGDESTCPTVTLIDVPGAIVAADDWHMVRIEVYGDTVTLYIDGELGLSIVDSEPIFNGYIGLEADRGTAAYFDDVRVIELDPTDAARQTQTATVIGDSNLRDGPGAFYNIIGTAAAGDTVTIIGRNTESTWLLVTTESGETVWIAASRIDSPNDLSAVPDVGEAASAMTVAVTNNSNLRDGPGTFYNVVGTITAGETVTIIGRSADSTWLLVTTESGETVWIAASRTDAPLNLAAVPITSR